MPAPMPTQRTAPWLSCKSSDRRWDEVTVWHIATDVLGWTTTRHPSAWSMPPCPNAASPPPRQPSSHPPREAAAYLCRACRQCGSRLLHRPLS